MNKTTQKKTQRYVHVVLRENQIVGVLTSAQSASEFKTLKINYKLKELGQNLDLAWSDEALKETFKWRIERHALD